MTDTDIGNHDAVQLDDSNTTLATRLERREAGDRGRCDDGWRMFCGGSRSGGGETEQTTRSYFVLVAVDEDVMATTVPDLAVEFERDQRPSRKCWPSGSAACRD